MQAGATEEKIRTLAVTQPDAGTVERGPQGLARHRLGQVVDHPGPHRRQHVLRLQQWPRGNELHPGRRVALELGELDAQVRGVLDVEDDQLIRRDSSRQFSVRAVTRIPEFNEYFGTEFEDEDYDTIGGLVTHELGRLPRRGESVTVDGIEFRVLRADRRRIETLRVTMPRDVPLRPEETSS